MAKNEDKYIKIFYSEALDNCEELNKNFTILEKDHTNLATIETIFRITHTLKGNAMGLGLNAIAELSHVMEDIFAEIKVHSLELNDELFAMLFKANDKLGELIHAMLSDKKIPYKGIRTKLSVYLNKNLKNDSNSIVAKPKEADKDKKWVDSKMEEFSGMEIFDEITLQQTPENNPQIESNKEVPNVLEEEEDHVGEDAEEELDEESLVSKVTFSDQIQVSVSKLDNLLNLVGELMIEKDALVVSNSNNSANNFNRLHRITSDLQYGVMDVRLVQIGFFFNKFYRTVRDAASIEKKKINLILEGTEIEIDRNILKIISDSMIHLIRNSVGHGIESPVERKKNGKPEEGALILRARNDKDFVIISIEDDGAGIDEEKIKKKAVEKGLITESYAKDLSKEDAIMLIFEPGFSSAEEINEISGRGVGMDVVKRAVESTGGRVRVQTHLKIGTTVELLLSSSMAVKGALLFELENQEYAIPLSYTEAVVSMYKSDIFRVSNGLMANYLDKTISITFLKDIFELNTLTDMFKAGNMHRTYESITDQVKLDVVVVSYGNKWMGIVVDKLLQQKEIVEKSLAKPLDKAALFSGATTLGNGNVCLVLDASSIIGTYFSDRSLR